MEKGSEPVVSSRPMTRWWPTADGGVRVWVDPMTEEAFVGSKHKGKSSEIILESSTKEDERKNYDEKLLSTPKTNSLSSEVLPQELEKAPESNFPDLEATTYALIGSKHKGKSSELILESSTEEDEQKNYDEKLLSTPKTNSLPSEVLPQEPEKAPESNCPEKEAYCTARSLLLDICIANNWSIPSYGLLEKGSSEEKIFTARVTVEVEFISSTLLECFSEPKAQKEEAQEQAAEGALWYLGHLGYFKP
ncbi:ribonuclease 3-like protein 1 [Iris pallida]|uniref:Ribonuclease 3-like protein 1 n=1 Tax=Iris pallida TaxID=29817 RepID=A0AAX6FMA4_IRIPA|nr:ribonuclease 3-like protein 1 [Iris pallida]KAJ6817500.1 ribonuclease 3-like protein 1 [Iris pallida]